MFEAKLSQSLTKPQPSFLKIFPESRSHHSTPFFVKYLQRCNNNTTFPRFVKIKYQNGIEWKACTGHEEHAGKVTKRESTKQYTAGKLGKDILLMMALDWDGSWI